MYATPYKCGTRRCLLCLTEKYVITRADEEHLLFTCMIFVYMYIFIYAYVYVYIYTLACIYIIIFFMIIIVIYFMFLQPYEKDRNHVRGTRQFKPRFFA